MRLDAVGIYEQANSMDVPHHTTKSAKGKSLGEFPSSHQCVHNVKVVRGWNTG